MKNESTNPCGESDVLDLQWKWYEYTLNCLVTQLKLTAYCKVKNKFTVIIVEVVNTI